MTMSSPPSLLCFLVVAVPALPAHVSARAVRATPPPPPGGNPHKVHAGNTPGSTKQTGVGKTNPLETLARRAGQALWALCVQGHKVGKDAGALASLSIVSGLGLPRFA